MVSALRVVKRDGCKFLLLKEGGKLCFTLFCPSLRQRPVKKTHKGFSMILVGLRQQEEKLLITIQLLLQIMKKMLFMFNDCSCKSLQKLPI